MSGSRALVLWAHPSSLNLGVQALAQGAAALLDRAGFRSVDHQDFTVGAGPHAPTLRRGLNELVASRDLSRWFSSYDLVMDMAGGDSFASIYGARRLIQICVVRQVAVRSGVYTLLGPQTLGPFETRPSLALAKWSLRGVHRVMARDTASQAFATSRLRVDSILSTDVVFGLPTSPRPPRASYDVLLNASGLLWTSDAHGRSQAYRALMSNLIRQLRAKGRAVTLFPHVLANNTMDDDMKACSDLQREIPGLKIAAPTDVASARAIIARSNLVVGSRMHACLNALSVGTPAVALSYSRKFAALFRDLGWSHVHELSSNSDDVIAAALSSCAYLATDQAHSDLVALRLRTDELNRAAVAELRRLSAGHGSA